MCANYSDPSKYDAERKKSLYIFSKIITKEKMNT